MQLWNPATGQATGAPLPADTGRGRRDGVAFGPDGKLLASADADGTVGCGTRPPGRRSAPPSGYRRTAGVNGVAFSPDGKLLASADADGTVRLWNPATGQEVGAPLPADTPARRNGVAFSPDGTLLATADADGTVRLWNTATRQSSAPPSPADLPATRAGQRGGVQPGRHAAGQRRRGRHRAAVEPGHRAGGRRPLQADTGPGARVGVAFSPDGTLLASADADGTVQLWNPATGRRRRPSWPTSAEAA